MTTHSGQGDESRLPAARPAHEGVVLPADGSEPWIPGVSGEQVAPAGGTPWGAPWGPQQGQGAPEQPYAAPLPPQGPPVPQQPYAPQPQMPGALPPQGAPAPQQPYAPPVPSQSQPQPQQPYAVPPVPSQSQPQQSYAPPVPPQSQPQQPLPQQMPGALPPQAAPGYGQPLPAEAGHSADSEATQYMAPVAGALPPESPVEATTFLGVQPPAGGGDADATQYLPPVPPQQQHVPAPPPGAPYGIRPGAPGDRQPPAEFDNLFRSEGGAGGAQETQQMPRYGTTPPPQAPQSQQPQQSYQAPQPYDPEPPRDRRSSRVPLIAAVVVGCAVLGLGASAVIFGGGDDDKGRTDNTTVAAATSPASGPTEAADPAKAQAEDLDKLLADSNDSRAAVIRSVEAIKACKNLDQAATDLRGAAEQRRGLVTRLEGLTLDKLPQNAELTASLKKAWEASAAADDHYATWAGQVKGKKGCPGGKARTTPQTGKATVASGEATQAKNKAAGLWNEIATKYGLTQRTSTQL
ncbi:hypothetical protein [Streptomyces sp. NPDC000410]|uniref:hypothetical protein n=1 Tax=Streptomyces sp. NPDC000410 TaxID=3154254 RepID=UPI00331FB4A6